METISETKLEWNNIESTETISDEHIDKHVDISRIKQLWLKIKECLSKLEESKNISDDEIEFWLWEGCENIEEIEKELVKYMLDISSQAEKMWLTSEEYIWLIWLWEVIWEEMKWLLEDIIPPWYEIWLLILPIFNQWIWLTRALRIERAVKRRLWKLLEMLETSHRWVINEKWVDAIRKWIERLFKWDLWTLDDIFKLIYKWKQTKERIEIAREIERTLDKIQKIKNLIDNKLK